MIQGLAIINVYFSICVYQVVPIINNRVCEVSTPAMDNIDTASSNYSSNLLWCDVLLQENYYQL